VLQNRQEKSGFFFSLAFFSRKGLTDDSEEEFSELHMTAY